MEAHILACCSCGRSSPPSCNASVRTLTEVRLPSLARHRLYGRMKRGYIQVALRFICWEIVARPSPSSSAHSRMPMLFICRATG